MGLITRAFSPVRNVSSFAPISISPYQSGRAQFPDNSYRTFADEGYSKNELVYAAIEELSTSAAEPEMMLKVGDQWTHDAPIIDLLENPNPFMDRFEFWATIIMHRSIAGNAYVLLIRSGSAKPVEMWIMRPDRVSVVPDSSKYISHYLYDVGMGEPVVLPVSDVLHFKTRNPLNDFYGMPPLMAASGRVDIDNFMKDFVKTYFERAGVPGGLLNVEGSMGEDMKRELKSRYSSEYGGKKGWHGLMVIDQKKASFTPMTANLGPSGLVIPELDEISEARILMCFGVPPELIGARVGMQNSSYAQKRSARESFWDETLAPLYKEMAGPVNLRLVPAFYGERRLGRRLPKVAFDLSDVRALQEDVDQISARERSDAMVGALTLEEYRIRRGYGDIPTDGTLLVPTTHSTVQAASLGEDVPVSTRQEIQSLALNGAQITSLLTLLQEVTAKKLAADTAKEMLRVAFPDLDESQINRLVDSAAAFEGGGSAA